ncbi:MAG: heme-binding protein [Pseudomonadota bacterium]
MLTRTAQTILALTALFSIAACSVVGSEAAPEPDYTVVRAEEAFEIRDYGTLVVVKTPMADGTRAAFGRLFDYISGENGGAREIAMTAPVLNADAADGAEIAMTAPVLQGGGDGREMIFILPADLTLATAPLPSDPMVSLGEIEPRRVAVVRYSGSMDDNADAEEARLREWMAENGLAPIGPAEVAGYNPPWTLPAYRRNEVLIPIADE